MLKKIKDASTFIIIAILILLFSVVSLVGPEITFSENENRYLKTLPKLVWRDLVSGEFATNYESYVNDQFWLRDHWIQVKSVTEFIMLKTENNGIVYGSDDYLFQKFYSFDANQLQKNLEAIDLFAFHAVSDVSVIVVPTASYPMIDNLPAGLPVVDEGFYINEIYKYLSNTTTPINVKDVLTVKAHEGEYVYYRTDHHWTTYGAWLAYSQFAAVNDLPAFDYYKYSPTTVPNFFGTLYSKAKNFNVVPDTLEYFDVNATLEVHNGTQVDYYDSIYNFDKFDQRDKYAAFLHGNNAYSVIHSEPGLRKEESALVICDSYGYSFIPFLTENYNTITVVDPRYYVGDYSEFRDTYYDDVIILYGFKTLTEVNLAKLTLGLPQTEVADIAFEEDQ